MHAPHRLPANSQKPFCLHGLSEDDKCSCSERLPRQCHLWVRVRLLTTNHINVVLGIAFLCQVLNCTENLPGVAKFHGYQLKMWGFIMWNVCIILDCEQDAIAIRKLSGALNA